MRGPYFPLYFSLLRTSHHLLPHQIDTRQSCFSQTWGRGVVCYQSHKMAAAKFSLKTQGRITPVYGALTSAWEEEISEQGSKKRKENLQCLRRGSLLQGHPSSFPLPLPLESRHRSSSLVAELLRPVPSPRAETRGVIEKGQPHALPWEDSPAGSREQSQ